jgi:hypothetical protein
MPKVSDIFALKYGHSLELNRLEKCDKPDAINFVGRAARNNGVTARVRRIPNLQPAPAGTITVALNGQGGAGVAFLQPFPYYSGFHVMVLTPKKPMSDHEKLWWAMCITANRFRFGFGRQANRTVRKIELPNRKSIPGWVSSVDFAAIFTAELAQFRKQSLRPPNRAPSHVGNERERISDLFEVNYGNSLELNRLTKSAGGVNFIARTAKNNGIAARVVPPLGIKPIAGGCLSVAVSGSVLETFVQEEAFLTSFHIMVLRPRRSMSMEELMFYASCVRGNQWRYSYGRQANRTLKDLMIPSRKSIPAWVYGSLKTVADDLMQKIES